MTGERKTELEQWFELRSVHLQWQDKACSQAVMKTVQRRRTGGDSRSPEPELPGIVLADFASIANRDIGELRGNWFVWLPRGWTNHRTLCIASSRIGRHPEQHPWWIAAIRTAGLTGFHDGFALLTGEGMTAAPFVRRLAQLLNADLLDLRLAPKNPDLNWFRKNAKSEEPGSTFPAWIFSIEPNDGEGPVDSLAIGLADSVRVIKVSDGGNVYRAVENRLQMTGDDGSVWLLADGNAAGEELRSTLTELGAIQWLLHDHSPTGNPKKSVGGSSPFFSGRIIALPDDADQFVAHWTRVRGRHPGIETEQERLDRLLFESSLESGNAIETLLSIVCSRRLLAGAALIRDSTPMISFTEVPLAEFPNRRVFRPHLGRWDFELFGIAIRKTAMQKLGARQVIYGGEGDWSALPEEDRPFFQFTRGENSKAIDWETEREWRRAGDLDLARFGEGDLFVFVPDPEVAEKVAGFSRWPVAILPPKIVLSD